jgi:uncharacterized protein with PIN domain
MPETVARETFPEKMIADAMLGKLARWLRVLGCDILYYRDTTDREIVVRALLEQRTILTRDRHFLNMKAVHHLVFLESEDLAAQLQQVIKALQLDVHTNRFSRCVECNTLLNPVEKADIIGRIPVYVYQHHEQFSRCPGCGRIYWAGTHLDRMARKIQILLGEDLKPDT